MSYTMSTRSSLGLIRQHFSKLGLELPAVLTDELEKIDAALVRSAEIGSDESSLAAAVFDAVYADREPTGAKVIQQAVLVQLARMNIKQQLEQEADRRRAEVLERFGDALIAEMSPVIDEADAAFAEARSAIPNLSLDPRLAAGLPADQMKAWGHARDAVVRVELVMAAWTLITRADQMSANPLEYRPLSIADLTLEELRALGTKPSVADIAVAGHRLSLATADEYRARLADVQEEKTTEAAKAERDAAHYARHGRLPDAPVPVLANPWAS